eukprot:scaffold846_cov252-Pinguiococcus_pyrenoidosus.AAC.6
MLGCSPGAGTRRNARCARVEAAELTSAAAEFPSAQRLRGARALHDAPLRYRQDMRAICKRPEGPAGPTGMSTERREAVLCFSPPISVSGSDSTREVARSS